MKRIIFVVLSFFPLLAIAQADDYSLAINYYNNQEYVKAAPIFIKLFNQRKSKFYFDYYVISLVKAKEYNRAIKQIKKQIKKHKQNPAPYYVDLGYVYKEQGDFKQAEKYFEIALKKLNPTIADVSQLANDFISFAEYQWAEKTYLKGQQITNSQFTLELANLYDIMRKYEKMVDAYLNLIKQKISNYSVAKNAFIVHLNNDDDGSFADVLEQRLLARIQKDDYSPYRKMLIWFYIQMDKYQEAFIQAKAYDKLYKTRGAQVYELAEAAMDNNYMDIATEAFNYIINGIGQRSPYYWRARISLLYLLYKKVRQQYITDTAQLNNLAREYLSVLNQIDINNKNTKYFFNYVQLQAFYLHNYSDALRVINMVINSPKTSDEQKASFLIAKGDVFIASNNLWEAILIYARVEENYKKLSISDKAKFKKALTYFYLGKFKWARAQFDILKGSTSKLIANDAIYMSYFLSENTSKQDTLNIALKIYAAADRYFFAHYYDSSLVLIDTILHRFAGYPITDDALFLQYKIYNAMNMSQQAVKSLDSLINNYPSSILRDKALFFAANLYHQKLNNQQKAKKYYKEILLYYKDSFYIEAARKEYRLLLDNSTK